MAAAKSTGASDIAAGRIAPAANSAVFFRCALFLGCALLGGALPDRAVAVTAATATAATARSGLDGDSCQTVRLADIGWTDVTATTALFSVLLRDLGYRPEVTVLSVPVTYASMKNKDIDVFLGNWMPSQEGDRKAYVADGSVDVLGANLTGAKYTLAVPAYAYEAGLQSFADIQRFATPLKASIFGIEPGNDGNRLILSMLKQNLFGLGDFKLIESSEQGMLAEVERAYRERAPIVFLAWDPHPMNMRFDLRYLSGGDSVFGANYGGASVYTNTRAGYALQCPNIGRLLMNLRFTLMGENQMMASILDQHQPPEVAAAAWLKANPAAVGTWLDGVYTLDGRPALDALRGERKADGAWSFEHWVSEHKIPVGDTVAVMIDYVKSHGRWVFDGISTLIRGGVDGLTALLRAVPSPLLILGVAALSWVLRRSLPLAAFVTVALLFIMNQGYWLPTLETLSLVIVAALVSTAIGVPLGIAAAHRPRLFAAMRPVLDLMQTLPTFVYLIPTLVLFGLGVVPGLISTVIFALPAPIRLTQLGISSVPESLLEAGQAFGATRLQMLWKIELPSAAPTIVAGVTQCIMLSLSMVVIAALVGAGGLGVPVVRALNTVQVGMGFEAGFVIVLLAIILDRISRPGARSNKS
ncbi:MAG: choline ABC transporter permease subunit [Steroidobacteraceae bacterium]|jgi:glycine betaine/proline transport system substrate-binding protein